MEVTSEPQCGRPFAERIDSKLTGFNMYPKPCNEPCTVRFRRCSVNFVSEYHCIGREAKTFPYNDELKEHEQEVAHPVDGGPTVFRTESACHGTIRRILMEVLPALLQYYDVVDTIEEGKWDEFVPADLVERIVQGAAGDGSYAYDVWMHVEVTRVYSEAEELMQLCEAVAVVPSDSAPPRCAPGAGDACPICMEELAGGVTGLPGCSHAFHRECILQWFGKAPTCPCCRRDIIGACLVCE